MAGDILWKERAIATITSTGASATNLSAVSAGADIDFRAAGGNADDETGVFELTCQWGVIGSIAAGTIIADLFLVPKMDGTNASQQLDTTAGASYIPFTCRVGGFIAAKVATANTDTKFISNTLEGIPLLPLLYTPYILNRSGQTIAANWTLKLISARHQYT